MSTLQKVYAVYKKELEKGTKMRVLYLGKTYYDKVVKEFSVANEVFPHLDYDPNVETIYGLEVIVDKENLKRIEITDGSNR